MLLYIAHWPVLDSPLRETLPAIFDGVELLPGEPDEDLYDERGRAPGVSHRAPARSRIPTLQTGPSGDANFGADSHPLNCLQIGSFGRLAGPLQRPVPHDFPSGPPRRAAAPGGLGSA